MRGSRPCAVFPPARRRFGDEVGGVDERLRAVLRERGIRGFYTHQARRDRARVGPSQRRHHDADRVGQDAVLQRARPERSAARSIDARAVSVSDQGARAGSIGGAAHPLGSALAPKRSRNRCVHLRRGYTAGRQARDPGTGAHRSQQPGHDPFRNPAASPSMGQAVREPAVRHHRRAACVSRRVRQSPDERAAASSAHLPALRLESDVHLLVRDNCEPARAGRGDSSSNRSSWCRRVAHHEARSGFCS